MNKLIIEFSADLSKQDIYAQGSELSSIMGRERVFNNKRVAFSDSDIEYVASINNPVLMTDYYRISRIENPTLRDSVFKLYESDKRKTIYNGTEIVFEQKIFQNVWGPSIDTILLCKSIDKIKGDLTYGVEIGCGSGFIGKYTAEHKETIENMEMIDLNPDAIECAKKNINSYRFKFIAGDAKEKLSNKYDIIVCNPPYVPRPSSIDDNPYEGLSLEKHIIDNLDSLLSDNGSFMSICSSVSFESVKGFIEDNNHKYEIIESMNVPFKIMSILNNESWMNYLLENNKITENFHEGYEYWHKIMAVQIRK